MSSSAFLVALILSTGLIYYLGRRKALLCARQLGGIKKLNSLPQYYSYLLVMGLLIPIGICLVIWVSFEDMVIVNSVMAGLPEHLRPATRAEESLLLNKLMYMNFADNPDYAASVERLNAMITNSKLWMYITSLAMGWFTGLLLLWRLHNFANVRIMVEKVIRALLFTSSLIAIFTTIGIVLSVLFESIRFFNLIPIWEFLFGTHWSPQSSIRSDQVASSGSFGSIPLFVGTLQISFLAMLVAVPVGLMSAIYLSEYANKKTRDILKPLLEILAGIPTVVYGFFAALFLGPKLRQFFEQLGFAASSESVLAAGLVMGLMIIPFISSLSDDVINAVPQTMRDGSFALGATPSETIKKVVIPAALPGIVSSILLAFSRAIGETMIVVMAAGLAANLTMNPMESVTTVTVQIVTLLVGDQEFDSAKTLASFALGLVLFFVTLTLNIIALHVVKRYREQYE